MFKFSSDHRFQLGLTRYGTPTGGCFRGPLSDGHELRKSFGANNFEGEAFCRTMIPGEP